MAQPAVADVRVSCPACGGPIHPIAGRCKHCKVDLVSIRGGGTGAQGTMIQIGALGSLRPAAAPALVSPPRVEGAAAATVSPFAPPTSSAPTGASPFAPPMVGPQSGAAPAASPSPFAPGGRGGLPMAAAALPPPVAFAPAIAARPRGSWSRRWPLLVAAVAAVAILVSVAILVFGGDSDKPRKRRSLGPAPDRMQTDSLPTDPWARPTPGSGAALDPGQLEPPPLAPPDISPDDLQRPRLVQPDDDDDDDSVGGVAGGVVGGVAGGASIPDVHTPGEFMSAAIDVGCQRLQSCWGHVPEVDTTCGQARALLSTKRDELAARCPRLATDAAGLCLRHLTTLPCPEAGTDLNDLVMMVSAIGSCARACE